MRFADSDFFERLPARINEELAQAGVSKRMDLLLHFPLRYEDWRYPAAITAIKTGETTLIEGEIVDVKPTGRQLLVGLQDKAGDIIILRFFRRTRILDSSMRLGRRLRAFGVVSEGRNGLEMAHPKLQSANQPGRQSAVYPAIGKITGDTVQKIIAAVLQNEAQTETVSADLRRFAGGEWTSMAAFKLLHHPPAGKAEKTHSPEHPAMRRLRFDELLAHQIVLRARRYRADKRLATAIRPAADWQKPLIEKIPFSLTTAQEKAIKEVCADLANERPMRRLLQGDVGSGKTAVAAFACLAAAGCGKIAVLMAPTGILANQHYELLSDWLSTSHIRCELLAGDIKGKKRQAALERLRFGLSRVVIGTHTLFQESVDLPPPALVVVDEQQRFGVEQRLAVAKKGGGCAHQLMLSATPIPRTLAMTSFADLDVSILAEKPGARPAINTLLISDARQDEVLARLAKRVADGGRAFWICPRVADAESRDLQDAETTVATAKRLHPELNPHILHGRMAAAKKTAAMESFKVGDIGLLVATTVVEVGVDVPQADVMVVANPERMGLSQLHQLRGRVGRGDKPGTCILLYSRNLSAQAVARLKALRENDDGFTIAKMDLSFARARRMAGR